MPDRWPREPTGVDEGGVREDDTSSGSCSPSGPLQGGPERIGTLGKEGLRLLEVCELAPGIEPAGSQEPVYQRLVLTLHVAVLILVPRTGPGETNPMSIA